MWLVSRDVTRVLCGTQWHHDTTWQAPDRLENGSPPLLAGRPFCVEPAMQQDSGICCRASTATLPDQHWNAPAMTTVGLGKLLAGHKQCMHALAGAACVHIHLGRKAGPATEGACMLPGLPKCESGESGWAHSCPLLYTAIGMLLDFWIQCCLLDSWEHCIVHSLEIIYLPSVTIAGVVLNMISFLFKKHIPSFHTIKKEDILPKGSDPQCQI